MSDSFFSRDELMRNLAKYEGRAENDDSRSAEGKDPADKTGVTVLLPDLDPQRTYKVMSPRLAHPEQAEDFVKEGIEELPMQLMKRCFF